VKVAFELTPAQAARLQQEAQRLGISTDDLAKAAVTDLLANPDDEFQSIVQRVLKKNEELYRRLA
jgi:hypothetical protein